MSTQAQKKASAKYDKENTKSVFFKFNKKRDADILAMLEEVENRQGYIKQLIRADIRGDQEVLPISSIQKMIQPVVKEYKIDRVFLFGSYARNEAKKDSDIDLIIEDYPTKGMLDFAKLQEQFEEVLGKPVDLVERSAIDKDNSRTGKRFRNHIEKEQVLIYG